jgi:hypothetical protein
VKIALYKNGTFNKILSTGVSNTTTHFFKWIIPFTQDTSSSYKIMVTSVSDTFAYDMSDDNFRIIPLSITVTSPDSGETLIRELTHPIRWTNTGYTAKVKIQLYKADTLNKTLTTGASNVGLYQGLYYWTIPGIQDTDADYKIKITSTSDSLGWGINDNYFTVGADSNPPTLAITSPNGGDTLIRGATDTIRWTSTGSQFVKIDLYKGGVFNKTVIASILNKGFYPWVIPFTQALGADYKIKVICVSDTSQWDMSDDNFSITKLAITVTSPDSGEE